MTGKQVLVERTLVDGEIVEAGRAGRAVIVNIAESPLTWLAARHLVTTAQLAAGEKLRSDFTRAGLGSNVTMNWLSGPGPGRGRRGGPSDRPLGAVDAKRRYHAALDAVGPGLSDVLWRVVCAGEGLADAETALGWPRRAGKLVLGLALDRLAVYYGIPARSERTRG